MDNNEKNTNLDRFKVMVDALPSVILMDNVKGTEKLVNYTANGLIPENVILMDTLKETDMLERFNPPIETSDGVTVIDKSKKIKSVIYFTDDLDNMKDIQADQAVALPKPKLKR